MPELILSSDEKPVLRCPLLGQPLSIGRSPVNDLSLPDDGIPPLYCALEPNGGGGYRMMSRCGQPVVVNGKGVDSSDLKDGDRIDLGALKATYRVAAIGDPAAAAAGQRTGILRTNGDGSFSRIDLALNVPSMGIREVTEQGLRVGAHPDNDIRIDDGFVSSFHAQIFARGERLFVRDLDSTNGTFVKGIRVIEAELVPNAPLKIGKTEIDVVTKETPETAPAVTGKGPWTCGDMVTSDAAFAKSFALIERVAVHDATVCVFGETGTGKELVAHALHSLSGRRRGPMVPLNCAAIPTHLIESMLFGHEKGAFTGADRQHKGVFEEAHEGTLFLDEIGELPLDLQSKLLRVLETRQVRRVGGRMDIPVDVRVIAATHRDLVAHVAEKKFREDLLHRLYIIPVQLPPLRDRKGDVVHLARHFITKLSPKTGAYRLSSAAEDKLGEHPFPGNVRELKNVIQRALILSDSNDVGPDVIQFIPARIADGREAAKIYRKGMKLEDIERQMYKEVLDAFDSTAAAARALGIAKSTLWRRALALGLLVKGSKAELEDGEDDGHDDVN